MAIHPPVEWAQRNDKVFVTIFVEDASNPTVEITDDKLSVKGTGGHGKQNFECEIEFYKPINSSACQRNVSGRFLSFMLPKQETGPYWPRLLKSDKKVHWLKVDFDKWKDEDDDDAELDRDMGFTDMMDKMGGLGGDKPDLADFEDSDNEELPDLEDDKDDDEPKSSGDHSVKEGEQQHNAQASGSNVEQTPTAT